RHKPPKLFAKLIQDMGKLSDAIALNDFDASKTIANGLAKLVRDNHQLIDSELEGYMQADATSVVQKLLSEQKFSQLALKNDFLTVDRFHALRNSIRLLLDLIRHLEAINKVFTPESVQYLVDLNKAFGHAHDTALKMTQGLSEEDALNSTMRVYSEVKAAANNFFSRLKIDLE
ncbi:MAG: hypothetical protein NTV34_14790, partial [Proteobacteria bacterium]|nr:hypothetical protein [Pseudomonadota bacterium]